MDEMSGKKPVAEKPELEQIVTGINRLFNRLILVDLKEKTYQFLENTEHELRNLPTRGDYSEMVSFHLQRLVNKDDVDYMERELTVSNLQEKLTEEIPYQRYEYRIRMGEREAWETAAVIPLRWEEHKLVSVLFAVEEITDIKQEQLRTQEALTKACEEAEAANHAKSDFLSRMSHDIRTPMNAIMGMTTVAFMHIDNRSRVEDCLNKINDASHHLLRLINEVLDMSKIESGKMELNEEPFNLSDTVVEILGILHAQIRKKKQKFEITLGGDIHEDVVGDAQRLSQVLMNILGNAVKFTPEGGHVLFRINEVASGIKGYGCYEFIVRDTGIGMDKEIADKIFEPFSRAADSRVGKLEGTGLGMPIAVSIARMMDGDIQVESKKGEGTKVTVTVYLQHVSDRKPGPNPLEGQRVMLIEDNQADVTYTSNILRRVGMIPECFSDADEALQELCRDSQGDQRYKAVILGWIMQDRDGVEIARQIRGKLGDRLPILILTAYDWSEIEEEALEAGVNDFLAKPLFRTRLTDVMTKALGCGVEEGEAETVLPEAGKFADKRMLLVEDNELNREIACELLSMLSFEIDTACNGREAVERIKSEPPGTYQVVLMDIQMPVMNGYEAARAIRKSGRKDLESLPIIAMTADAFSDDVKKAAAAGMNGHISKPIDVEKLTETLKDWII